MGGHIGYRAKLCNIFSLEFIGVSVFLNDSKLKLNNFKDYIQMYLKSTPRPDREDLTKRLVFE
ncbi:hypothetical protein L0F63_002129 [Massospora cicadina]|nr:hypothetical protein L0F63_002129 [Massospora cicadina]